MASAVELSLAPCIRLLKRFSLPASFCYRGYSAPLQKLYLSCLPRMLHEILLALSGHPSPLLSPPIGKPNNLLLSTLLSPAEVVLLRSLAEDLGDKHKNTRESAIKISNGHPSIVCRAVSTAIISVHLAAFQRKILEVEKDILERNSEVVGACNIVPLSGLVAAFDGWKRKLEWLWRLVQFIRPSEVCQEQCTASLLLDYLREATRTGYPDIEQISLHLVEISETAWLKQISAWILYGRFPTLGAVDIFITETESIDIKGGTTKAYGINSDLLPQFVTDSSANSILFIGKALNHIREKRTAGIDEFRRGASPELELLSTHLACLSSLTYPINASRFSAVIDTIRLSLSRNALQKLLPLSKVLEILRVLKDFFLLERGEFSIALISAADQRLEFRQNRSIGKLKKPGFEHLGSMIIKDGEVSAILAKTWTTLSCLYGLDDEDGDGDLDLARELFRLSLKSGESALPKITAPQAGRKTFRLSPTNFNDFLLPTPTSLSLRVLSPLDLFLSPLSIEAYSHIHAYLLAIRRGHLHLSQLFLLSNLRRDHPSPRALYQADKSKTLGRMRERASRRSKAMRPIWASIGSATFLLTELGEYLQGHVIKSSWKEFHAWLDTSTSIGPISSPGKAPRPAESGEQRWNPSGNIPAPHDPETLSQAHHQYISSLLQSLFLNHAPFTQSLRVFLLAISHLAALLQRLSILQEMLDLGTDTGPGDAWASSRSEEDDLMNRLRDRRAGLDSGAEALVEVLREIDQGRTGSAAWTDSRRTGMDLGDEKGFSPWSGGSGSVERLLLKLDRSRRYDQGLTV